MNRIVGLAKPAARLRPVMQSRGMASDAAANATGWEAAVRAKLPKDEQIVAATLGTYLVLGLLFKLKPSKKAPEAEKPAVAASTGGDIPSIADDSFDEWSKAPGNMERWEKAISEYTGE